MRWTSEFEALDFKEKRLTRRFFQVMTAFSKRPGDTIAGACGNWQASKAAYRLLSHRKFDREQVLDHHREKTIERMKGHEVILAIQDTSAISYQSHLNAKGLGVVGTSNSKSIQTRGLMMHSLLAVTPEMVPLGLLEHKTWGRIPKKERPAGTEKESRRWLETLKQSFYTQQQLTGTSRVITVSDRESDMMEYLGAAFESESEVVVRARQARVDFFNSKQIAHSMSEMPVLGSYELKIEKRYVPRGNYRRKTKRLENPLQKNITVEVRAGTILIRVKGLDKVTDVPFNCVYVKEKGNSSEEPLEWILITNLKVDCFEDAKTVISYYKCRWFIEVFHKTLKSGCGIEESRLAYAQRLENYILLMSIVAVQICMTTYLHRSEPEKSCEAVLTESQWRALYLYYNKAKPLPKTAPTISQATVWIARLGGFLARKNDGYPGTLSLWKGWLRMHDIHEAYARFFN